MDAFMEFLEKAFPYLLTIGLPAMLMYQLVTGVTLRGRRTRSVSRAEEPGSYWGIMLFQTVVVAFMLSVVWRDAKRKSEKAARDSTRVASSTAVAAQGESAALSPRDSAILLQSQGQYAKAIAAFDIILQKTPTDAELHYWRAVSHWKLNHIDTALAGMRKVIELQPDYYAANRDADYLLASQGRWTEIIPIWDAYIARNPKSADAYFERGGTNYRMSRRAMAIADAAKACELGLAQACAMVQRLR